MRIFLSAAVVIGVLKKKSAAVVTGVLRVNTLRKSMNFGNMPDCRYVSDCRSRDCKFNPGQIPYFRGD